MPSRTHRVTTKVLLAGILGISLIALNIAELRGQALDHALRIAGEGNGYFLTRITKALFTPTGGLLLQDAVENSLLEFNSKGTFIRRIGREGGGPGEFKGINRVGYLADTLWIQDYQLRRVSWFANGELVRVETVEAEESGLPLLPATFLVNGLMVIILPAGGRIIVDVALRDGTRIEHLGDFHTAPIRRRIPFERDRDGVLNAVNPLADHAISAAAGDGSGIALVERPRPDNPDSAQYTVVAYRDGRRIAKTFPYVPKPLQSYEREKLDGVIDSYHEQIGKIAGWRHSEIEDAFLAAFGDARFAVPVYDALMTAKGDVWLSVSIDENGRIWNVLDANLNEKFRVRFGPEERVLAASEDRVVVLTTDEYNVPSVSVYLINPAGGS
ncbi:MAG TPA: 6-bladed beta-propeller [Longimicrobiales bacterium]|nr:6-bladed beta-propeller [Longimicrobiales bacterium]